MSTRSINPVKDKYKVRSDVHHNPQSLRFTGGYSYLILRIIEVGLS
jgi:hypothetical protein